MRTPLSVRTHVLGLIIVVVVPLLAFSAFLVIRSAEHEQEILGATVRDRARAVARSLEGELAGLRSQLFILANSTVVEPGNLGELRARANAVFGQRNLAFVLSGPDGKEILDTRLPPDAPLPDSPDKQSIHYVTDWGLPSVSDLTRSPKTHAPAVMIHVPVLRQGTVAYVASLDVMPALERVLEQQQLPPGWLGTILDRQGYTLARTLDAQQFIGRLGSPDFLTRVNDEQEGWLPFPSREGVPMYVAFSHVNPVGWVAVIGIPLEVLYTPVRTTTREMILLGIATLGLALGLASFIGRRIASPIAGLVRYAEIVGRGVPVRQYRTGLAETDAVASSLHRANENLHRTLVERELASAALIASEERKHLLHQAVLAQEAERTHIARELHDSLGQYLTALQLGLNAMGRCTGADTGSHDQMRKLRDLTAEIGREVNRIAWELRPTALDDLGLEKAIGQYLEEWAERSRLQFDVQVNLGGRRLPQTVETVLYRALQEAVTNVVRHAQAHRVGVILEATETQAQLIVEDDGIGFVVGDANGTGEGPLRLGLRGIRERLALVDGTLDVESSPGGGTTLFVRVPF